MTEPMTYIGSLKDCFTGPMISAAENFRLVGRECVYSMDNTVYDRGVEEGGKGEKQEVKGGSYTVSFIFWRP